MEINTHIILLRKERNKGNSWAERRI